MSDYACLVLPFPPSVNGLFAGKARRFKSGRYKEWELEAGMAIMRQRPIPNFTDRVKVTYTYGRPDRRTRDVFNYEKAVSDLLVTHGILADDGLIEKGVVMWSNEVRGVQVEIEPYAAAVEAAGMCA